MTRPATAVPEVMIRYDGVDKHFLSGDREVRALRDIDLSVRRNEFVSVVGPSGCGKTTLIRLCAGLESSTGGGTFYKDRLIGGVNTEVGYITQDSNLYPWMTLRNNVEFPLEIRGVPEEERRERSDAYIRMVGLRGFEESFPYQLSGGMQKRASIIRTMIYDPEVLLMDEPFASLDAQTRMVLQSDLLQIWSHQQKTILFITHDLSEAIALSDTVVVMSARPGTIKRVFDVPLSRPRNVFQIHSHDGYTDLYADIWEHFRNEVVESDDGGRPEAVELPPPLDTPARSPRRTGRRSRRRAESQEAHGGVADGEGDDGHRPTGMEGSAGVAMAAQDVNTAPTHEVAGETTPAATGHATPEAARRLMGAEAGDGSSGRTAASGSFAVPPRGQGRGRVSVGLPGDRRRGSFTTRVNVVRVLVAVVFLGVWQAAVDLGLLNPLIFSSPLRVAQQLWSLFVQAEVVYGRTIYEQISVTLEEMAIGYVFGAAIGLVLGYVLARSELYSRALEPYILAVYGVPKIALAPVFVMILGIGLVSKVGIVAMELFFMVFFNTFAGIRNVDREHIQLAQIMGASKMQTTRSVIVPAAMPSILLGLKMGIPFAMIGAIVGEFVASNKGLGWFILYSSANFDASSLFSAILILVIVVWVLSRMLAFIESRVLRWQPNRREAMIQF